MALFFQFSLPTQRLCRRFQPLTLPINRGGLNVSLSASIHSVSGWGSVIFGTGHNAKIQHPKGGLQLFVSFNLKLTFCER